MSEMTLAGLRLLREVAARGSFSAAGAEFGYTQSAVSRTIAALEAHVGAPLFTRGNRGVALTDDGQLLVRHAAAVIDRLGSAEREIAARHSGSTRSLRVGAFSSAMVALVPGALRTLREREPDIRVTLREGLTATHVHRVRAGTLDLAVVSGDDRDWRHDLHVDHLLDDPLLLAVGNGHPLAGARSVAADDLAGQDWIAGRAHSADTVLGAWELGSWTPRATFVVRDWNAKIGLVAAGLGVTVVPGLAAPSLRGRVHVLRIDHPAASRPVSVIRPAEPTTNTPGDRFLAALRDHPGLT